MTQNNNKPVYFIGYDFTTHQFKVTENINEAVSSNINYLIYNRDTTTNSLNYYYIYQEVSELNQNTFIDEYDRVFILHEDGTPFKNPAFRVVKCKDCGKVFTLNFHEEYYYHHKFGTYTRRCFNCRTNGNK